MVDESRLRRRQLRSGLWQLRNHIDYLLRLLDDQDAQPTDFSPEVDTTSHSLAEPPLTKKKKDTET